MPNISFTLLFCLITFETFSQPTYPWEDNSTLLAKQVLKNNKVRARTTYMTSNYLYDPAFLKQKYISAQETFDKNGNILSLVRSFRWETTQIQEYEYDNEGRLIWQCLEDNYQPSPVCYWEYEYKANSYNVTAFTADNTTLSSTTYLFVESGKLSSIIHSRRQEEYGFLIDSAGNSKQHISYFIVSDTTLITYSGDTITYLSSLTGMPTIWVEKYNSSNYLIETALYHADTMRSLNFTELYEYDANYNMLSKLNINYDGMTYQKECWLYNDNNLPAKKITYHTNIESPQFIEEYTYEFYESP